MGVVAQSALALALAALILAYLVNRTYHSLDLPYNEFQLRPTREFDGPLSQKYTLGHVEYLGLAEVIGPESFVLKGDEIFTTAQSCEAIRYKNGKIVQRFPFVENQKRACAHSGGGPHCCFPVGLRHWHDEVYLLADGGHGLLEIDFRTEKVRQVVHSSQFLGGHSYIFFDDLSFVDNNTIIASDMSPVCWPHKLFLCLFLDSQDSRLLKVDLKTGTVSVLLENMSMLNGVQKHHDGESVLVDQTVHSKVLRYYYAGPKKGKLETFLDGLPGSPDNIRVSPRGNTYWISMYGSAPSGTPLLFQRLSQYPNLRKYIVSFLYFLGHDIYHNVLDNMFSTNNVFIEVDGDGNILRSIHDPEGKVSHPTEIQEYGNHLYIASIKNKYIAKAELPKA